MATLTIMPSGNTSEVAAGTTLLAAILAAGEKLVSKCDGEAKCGECHVAINEGRKSLSKIQRAENAKLDEIVGVSSKSRLACQAQMGEENVTVEILSFV
jgi:2Fe-2S ferredoxin